MRRTTGGWVGSDNGHPNSVGCVAKAGFVYLFFDQLLEGTKIVTQALCSRKPQAMSVRETDVTKKLSTVQLFL